MLKLLFVAIFLSFANGQLISPGTCVKPTPITFFNPGAFFNYGYYITWKYPETVDTICNNFEFSFTPGLNNISITLSKFISSTRNVVNYYGTGQLGSCPIYGYADVQLPTANINAGQFTVLGTDYSNWATMYLCNQVGSNKEEYLWITAGFLPSSNDDFTAIAKENAASMGFNISALIEESPNC